VFSLEQGFLGEGLVSVEITVMPVVFGRTALFSALTLGPPVSRRYVCAACGFLDRVVPPRYLYIYDCSVLLCWELQVSDKKCVKIHHLAPNIYCCGAGTAADADHMTGSVVMKRCTVSDGCEACMPLCGWLCYAFQRCTAVSWSSCAWPPALSHASLRP
jgi:hypothetical protein